MHSLRYGWTQIVQADDYELHMANIGQAEANAKLVRDLLFSANLTDGATVVFAGAGPGQMFEYDDAGYLKSFNLTLTDINESFLGRLAARAVGILDSDDIVWFWIGPRDEYEALLKRLLDRKL